LELKMDKPREKMILSVGRFFGHLHSKRQDIVIGAFKKLKQRYPFFRDFKLVLVGGVKKEDNEYFLKVKKLARMDKSIIFKPNASLEELYKYYKMATYFWHFTGYGTNESINPDQVEHFGLTPLEAMASGCLTFCYQAGGPKETIIDGKNGFLFDSEEQLLAKMDKISLDNARQKLVNQKAKDYVLKNFSYEVFRKKVKNIIF